jgi:DNA-binding transcriptional MerR regulator
MNPGLKRRATFEEALYLPGPNLDLPQRIASQLIDSPYLIKKLGDDMGQTAERRAEEEDMARAVDRHAREQNVPIRELRGLFSSTRPQSQFDPFYGQAAHETRAAQAEILAKIEFQRVGLHKMFQEQEIARKAAADLARTHGGGIAEIAGYLAARHKRETGHDIGEGVGRKRQAASSDTVTPGGASSSGPR